MFIPLFKKTKDFLSKLFEKSFTINYIFFSLFLLAITFFSAFKTNILFTIYSLFQASALICILIPFHYLIKSKIVKKIFISLSFFILLAYSANFILLGLMNNNLFFAMNIFFSGGIKNLLVTLRAINLNFNTILILLVALILVPMIGIFTYYITNKISQKKPLKLKQKHLFSLLLFLFIALFSIDSICKHKNIDYIFLNKQKLPIGSCFLSQKNQIVNLDHSIYPIRDEKKLLNVIDNSFSPIEKRPNIFIFVVEALRHDYITQNIAPNIYSFKQNNTIIDTSYSASNASQISWYSIFHSNHPIYWSAANKNNKLGSLPLNILRKIGYKINVFSSAELEYFQMDNLLFGQKNKLVDNYRDFSKISSNPSTRDNMAIDGLIEDISKPQKDNSNVYIVFLDSTHSEYNWRDDFQPKFLPIASKINYITLSQSRKELNLVKNRYKNAINYIDHLFAKVINTLKDNDLYEDSLIVFTADHGEEFFEKGSLFHASHLNNYQIQIPIIYKLLNKKIANTNITTHIDIFPTILGEILPDHNLDNLFDGRSIFHKNRYPYVITANQRGALSPNQVLLSNEHMQILGKIKNLKYSTYIIVNEARFQNDPTLEKEVKKAFGDLAR